MGFFQKIKDGLTKTREALAYKLNKLFTGGVLDDEFYDELETILLTADIGIDATDEILARLRESVDEHHLRKEEDVKTALRTIMIDILSENEIPKIQTPAVVTVVGVNGVGKTTAIGKLAHLFTEEGKSVIIAAADTFRAAANDQLSVWAQRAKVKIVNSSEGADPSSVVFDAIASAKAKHTDIILVDTAGRLQNKKNLMEELKKISRVTNREFEGANIYNLLVLDATTGQNALSQVEVFNDAVSIDGLVLNKLDGTAKGGVALAIAKNYSVPVMYIGVGEGIDDIRPFEPEDFAQNLI